MIISNINIQFWYEILILSVSDIQYCLNYTKGIRHKKRETTKIMERCHFEMDKTQDREYQLDVARADVYIHSIHFLPVRWGEMRTPCRKRTSPAHNTRGGSHYMKKIGFSNKWWLWKKIVRFAYLVSVSQGGWWL